MKKSGLTFLFMLSCIASSHAIESSVLTPEGCSVGDRPFTAPMSGVYFTFDGSIKLLEGASATIECEGETIAKAIALEASNYRGTKRTQGTLTLIFEEQNLPKGKSYKVCVASGSIWLENETDIQNPKLEQRFDVPENLGAAHFDFEDGSVITTVSNSIYSRFPTIYWGIETEPVGNPYFILYREGIPVRQIPACITWDWDLGQAYADVQETMNFEQGVNYTLTLPAGSAHAWLRDDIVNEEVSFNFIGGYTEPIESPTYSWCSLFNDHSNVLNEVTFTFMSPIRLAENAVIQLWYADESELIMEAPAYINTNINCFAISADFGGFEMTSEKGYALVIPEGTVIAEKGDPMVNHRCSIPVADYSGITTITNKDIYSITYDLNGRRVNAPISGKMYIRDGKTFLCK